VKKLSVLTALVVFAVHPFSHLIAAGTADAPAGNGPTIILDYAGDRNRANTAAEFMYFVPTISPTLTECHTSRPNTQTVRLISFTKQTTDTGFFVCCQFEMKGKGRHTSRYLPAPIIEMCSRSCKGDTLKNILDYIMVEGEGYGSIEVTGTILNGEEIVDVVEIHFNKRGCKSPVRIGLYDIRRVNGRFDYAHRYNEMIVRVNTLVFRRSDKEAKMEVAVASVRKAGKREGLWARFKGTVANLFMPPVEIDPAGNTIMLNFGRALYRQKNSFTFPRARNLVESSHEMACGLPGNANPATGTDG